jgi:hypothetical protein
MQGDSAFRDGWCGRTGIARILSDPIARCTDALVSPGLVLADGDRFVVKSRSNIRSILFGSRSGVLNCNQYEGWSMYQLKTKRGTKSTATNYWPA